MTWCLVQHRDGTFYISLEETYVSESWAAGQEDEWESVSKGARNAVTFSFLKFIPEGDHCVFVGYG